MESFNDVKKHLVRDKKRHINLLLGNGFSMAFNTDIFSYNALSRHVERSDDPILKQLFSSTKNRNFEEIMRLLDAFYQLSNVFDLSKTSRDKIQIDNERLQSALIEAIKALHPEHVFKVPQDESEMCYAFLKQFIETQGKIFTTNYDLLLYWVLMRNVKNDIQVSDGFGREADDFVEGEYKTADELDWSELRWGKHKDAQNIYYLHGALPFFDTGTEIIKEEYEVGQNLLDKIQSRMAKHEYPIFVTAGDGNDKLKQIMHNSYLSFCFEQFTKMSGSLITYGFGFGEYDEHIVHAINEASKQPKDSRLWSIYIGVFNEKDVKHIESIQNKFKCKVHIFDAKTANIWRE
jgi:hypothetical protein